MLTEELTALARFHQFDETQLDGTMLDPVQKGVKLVMITGGTGLTEGDQAPEALLPLFDREVEGFGEVFRMLSFEEIGTSTLQSRAVAGVANKTLIFAMPGSTKACRTAWENIIAPQLDARTRPCNFHPHLKK